jgi:hypothetical protein
MQVVDLQKKASVKHKLDPPPPFMSSDSASIQISELDDLVKVSLSFDKLQGVLRYLVHS